MILTHLERQSQLKLPENYYPKLRHFIEAVKISCLSKAVERKPATGETPRIEQHLTERIQEIAPYIWRYLYHLEHDIYEWLKEDETLIQLKNMRCYSVENLQVEYMLNQQSVYAQRNAILYDGNLYVQNDCLEDTDYLAVELSKLFKEVKGLDDFINLLLNKKSKNEIENLLKVKGIRELPLDEQKWFGIVKPVLTKDIQEEDLVETEEEETTIRVEHGQAIHSEAASINLAERKMLKSQINTTIPEPLITEKTEWQPEVEPGEAEINIEKFMPRTKEDRPLVVEKTTDKYSSTLSDEEYEVRDTLSYEEKRAIGRWGEEYVLECLKETLSAKYPKSKLKETEDGFVIYSNRQKIVEVHWLNKEGDEGEGCDIIMIENGNEEYIEEYIEVKSTKTDTKEWFKISRNQWEFAQEKEDKFHIYRVYGAGTKHPRLIPISNLIKFWQEGGLIAYPIRIQI